MTSEWMFWIAGGVLGITGLWLACWALLSDRAKGRKRCPRCWYNMQGAESLRCPECGHTAKRERKLRKTRRRWRWACFAVLLLLGSFSLEVAPIFRSSDWREKSSTTLLVLHTYLTNNKESFSVVKARCQTRMPRYSIVNGGFDEDVLVDWQWRLMMSYAVRQLEKSPVGMPDPQILDCLSVGPPYAGSATDSLASLLEKSSNYVASRVISDLHHPCWFSRSRWPRSHSSAQRSVWVKALINNLTREGNQTRLLTVGALEDCGPEAAVAVPLLLALLEEDDVDLRVAATEGIAAIATAPVKWGWGFEAAYVDKRQIDHFLSQVGTGHKVIIENLKEYFVTDESEEVQLAIAISLCQDGEETSESRQLILDNLMRPKGRPGKIFGRLRAFSTRAKFLLPGIEHIVSNPQDYYSYTVRDAKEMKQRILESDSP